MQNAVSWNFFKRPFLGDSVSQYYNIIESKNKEWETNLL